MTLLHPSLNGAIFAVGSKSSAGLICHGCTARLIDARHAAGS